jgi:hypothetical protein
MAEKTRRIKVERIIAGRAEPKTLNINSSLTDVAKAIASDPNHLAVVMDGGKVKGVLSDEDIVTWVRDNATKKKDMSKVKALDLNPKPMISVYSESSLDDAIEKFRMKGVGKLLVTDSNGKPIGILTKMTALDTIRKSMKMSF